MADSPDLDRREIDGSTRAANPGATYAGRLDPEDQIELTLVLRRRAPLDESALTPGVAPLTATDLAARYGADPADVELVRDVITAAGGEILRADPASRRVQVIGAAAIWTSLFGTELSLVTSPDLTSGQPVRHRHRTGALRAPSALAGVLVAVLGLDNRPQAEAHFRRAEPTAVAGIEPAVAGAPAGFTPLQLATAYSMPAGDGTGQTLAIIELGGGFGESDLSTYFKQLKLSAPKVTAVGVDGAINQPGADPSGADGEVLLDIEVTGAIVPKAHLVVYFAPNTDAGFLDAIAEATHAQPTPTAISISWGQSEDQWTKQARTAMDQAFTDAAALGITVTVAAGDSGSADGATGTQPHVDFPASSPHVLACGGTSLLVNRTGGVQSESVWNNGPGSATGGGVSDTFAQPAWQANVGVPVRAGSAGTGRGVPDVAADADPHTGYRVLVDGQAQVIGGTSAVAPLWAALVCRLVQATGTRLGLLQPHLYAGARAGRAVAGLRDITSGSNGAYPAGPGWDACTGLGVPDGTALLATLRNH
jgi:kumamolisin